MCEYYTELEYVAITRIVLLELSFSILTKLNSVSNKHNLSF